MKIEIFADAQTVAEEAARLVASEARSAIAERGRFVFAVSGGHTPWIMLRALAKEDVPWDKVHLAQVDERVAPAGHADRNLTHLQESLLEHAPLPPNHIYAMAVESPDLEDGAKEYATLMELPTIFVFTHDAMGDGEDGPTHQPVEHLASLRAIPGLVTLRPGDANEVVEAYRYVLQLRHQPAVLALSRQPLPTLDRAKYEPASGVAQGAYILADAPGGDPEVILIASGSEVSLAVEAYERLLKDGIRARVVSMPSWDIFERQTQEYRDSVLPPNVKARVAVEQASTFGWERYVGEKGRVIGMHTFGAGFLSWRYSRSPPGGITTGY